MGTLASDISYEYLRQKCAESEPESEIREGTFASQAQIFLESLSARRTPAKPATISTWRSIIDAHIVPQIGQESLASFDNGAMKRFVDFLCNDGELSPRHVRDVVLVTKLVLKSAVDENGNYLYPRVWNNSFLDLPRVKVSNARAATREIIEDAIKSCPKYATVFALAAATGLRIGEMLAIRIGDDGENTCWVEKDSVIHVRKSMWRGRGQDPKTLSAHRSVDLCAEINAAVAAFAGNRTGYLFASRKGTPLSTTTVYKHALSKTQILGAHALRRFRVSHLRKHFNVVPEDLLRYWIGHANRSQTDGYSRLAQDVPLRKRIVEQVGLGFDKETI
jgi:integrase